MSGRTCNCAQCGDVFESAWSEEEARAEMVENFGDLDDEDRVVVCDPCYQAMVSTLSPSDYMRGLS